MLQQTLAANHVSPQSLIKNYEQVFRMAYGRDPRARHIGGQWYYVNGETVHRVALMAETSRLRHLAEARNPFNVVPTKSLINRLITRLRSL